MPSGAAADRLEVGGEFSFALAPRMAASGPFAVWQVLDASLKLATFHPIKGLLRLEY